MVTSNHRKVVDKTQRQLAAHLESLAASEPTEFERAVIRSLDKFERSFIDVLIRQVTLETREAVSKPEVTKACFDAVGSWRRAYQLKFFRTHALNFVEQSGAQQSARPAKKVAKKAVLTEAAARASYTRAGAAQAKAERERDEAQLVELMARAKAAGLTDDTAVQTMWRNVAKSLFSLEHYISLWAATAWQWHSGEGAGGCR
jgi:hypothetical protein